MVLHIAHDEFGTQLVHADKKSIGVKSMAPALPICDRQRLSS
jgi:hypothetical protein